MNPSLELPPFLIHMVQQEFDDRPVPELGLGDQEAAVALLAATRAVLAAQTEKEIITAIARFGVRLGGRMVPAAIDTGSALPVDIALGTGPAVLFEAEAPSLARMRLEQCLPMLVEDARTAISRLRHIEDIRSASGTDPLTGLLSRRELMRQMPGLEIGDVICLLDIDHFKAINERDGHVGGDLVLHALGRLIATHIRDRDCAGRYGGDELVILFKAMPEAAAVERLDRLQRTWLPSSEQAVTFYGGVASVDERGWEVAFRNADAAMYQAKKQGRGRAAGHGDNTS